MGFTKATGDYIDQSTLTSINTGIDWQTTPKTSDFTAVSGEGYLVDTTSAAITVTLPTSPSEGDEIIITDYASNAATNNITLDPGTLNLRGATDDLVLSTNNQSVHLLYSGATKGWLVTTEAGAGTAAATSDLTVDYLVVAGGGAGGKWGPGGGGGAGGLRTSYGSASGGGSSVETSLSLAASTNYTVTIGAGGTARSNGSDSTFATITSTGGGRGAGDNSSPIGSSSGGSGGGGSGEGGGATSGNGTANQGFAGGDGRAVSGSRAGGGGGGASIF